MREIIEIVGRMAPYLLLGFGLAGLMHSFVPTSLYRRYLGRNNFRSVVNAAMVGIPLPLCSCGVIPTAMSLRKEGASKAATVSFLIATPQTGVDSIIATYSLLGLPFAIIRPIAALVTSLLGGLLVSKASGSGEDINNKAVEPSTVAAPKRSFVGKIMEALRYAYVEMMQDIGRMLFIGLVAAGLITVLLPADFFAHFADHSLLAMLIVLVAAIPMYLCATGSIPIAVALMLKGLSPGAAFVLLMAGPAINAASVMVVGKVLGRRTLILYLLSITLGAIGFGLGIDYLLPREWFLSPLQSISSCHEEGLSWLEIGSSVVLLALLLFALIRRYTHGHSHTATTIHITGLRCNKCKANAERAIGQIEGVESAEIELSTGLLTMKGGATIEQLREVIEPLGFGVEESQS